MTRAQEISLRQGFSPARRPTVRRRDTEPPASPGCGGRGDAAEFPSWRSPRGSREPPRPTSTLRLFRARCVAAGANGPCTFERPVPPGSVQGLDFADCGAGGPAGRASGSAGCAAGIVRFRHRPSMKAVRRRCRSGEGIAGEREGFRSGAQGRSTPRCGPNPGKRRTDECRHHRAAPSLSVKDPVQQQIESGRTVASPTNIATQTKSPHQLHAWSSNPFGVLVAALGLRRR